MKLLGPLLVLSLAPAIASANIIPTGTSITGVGALFTWNYNLQLARDQSVNAGLPPIINPVPSDNLDFGGFFTIFDFAGYQAGSCSGPAGWTCTAQLTGFTPSDVIPTDDSAIINLTWAYTSGPTILGQPSGVDLGNFSAQSIYGDITQVSYAARGIANIGGQAGTNTDNVGNTDGPTAVPEPTTLALMLGAAFGLLIKRKSITKSARLLSGSGATAA